MRPYIEKQGPITELLALRTSAAAGTAGLREEVPSNPEPL